MSPTVFSQLDKSLHDHLAALVHLSATADDPTAADLARTELPRVVAALRALLDEHTPDPHGRCPTCRTHRSRRFSRKLPSPCRAYLGAQLALTVTAETPGLHRHVRTAV
ncbi:hypothetical protein [Saccharothrix variisporea]|uniref:Uncharacterized protein n=1 Tax=Saccharothrix variisporea TaxID=543527 RepID=A0A495XJI1_9PSEU|nr:hypothetical protein [Saccharothrix variisporea]RKT73305.1 hypothetical protein DFJ66_6635 [Saccharothrix variisporea]